MNKQAFLEDPDLTNDQAMLFDHALLQGKMGEMGEMGEINFTVGNLMALSAPGKGMKKFVEGRDENKVKVYSENIKNNGPKLTEEFIKIVKEIVNYKENKDLDEDIKYIQKKWPDKSKKFTVPEDFKERLKAEIKNKRYREKPEKSEKSEKSLLDRIEDEIGLPPGMSNKKEMIEAIEGEIDDSKKYCVLQSLGNNSIWDAQNLGGFEIPTGSNYLNIQGEQMGEDNSIVSPTVEGFVKKSIPDGGILFLCESALLFGHEGHCGVVSKEGINHILVHKDTKYEKVYSAIWERDEITVEVFNNDLSTGKKEKEDITKEDYCIFSVRKEGSEVAKVVVVHANDKVAKKGEKKKWESFLQKCVGMDGNVYVVGDTNVTEEKTKTNTTKFDPFKDNSKYVENAIVTGFNIIKKRVPGNIWQNNQIYKFKETQERDGMVILTLKGSEGGEVGEVGVGSGTDVDVVGEVGEVGEGECEQDCAKGGRKRRRRKTKKKRKSKRKSKRKRKPKRKSKRKRKKRRTKKR